MKGLAPLDKDRVIGDLVGQGVFEGVLDVADGGPLVSKSGRYKLIGLLSTRAREAFPSRPQTESIGRSQA